jgi:phenylpropionate dioxygenase-like ring-hydroxylating dioxygenase large terminal subunit
MGDAALQRNPELPAELARTLVLSSIYPSQVIVVAPETLIWFVTHPHGVDRARVQWGIAQRGAAPAAETPEGEAYRAALRRGVEAVNAEDRALVAGVQRGLRSERAESGDLSHLERPIWEFTRYLARQLSV